MYCYKHDAPRPVQYVSWSHQPFSTTCKSIHTPKGTMAPPESFSSCHCVHKTTVATHALCVTHHSHLLQRMWSKQQPCYRATSSVRAEGSCDVARQWPRRVLPLHNCNAEAHSIFQMSNCLCTVGACLQYSQLPIDIAVQTLLIMVCLPYCV